MKNHDEKMKLLMRWQRRVKRREWFDRNKWLVLFLSACLVLTTLGFVKIYLNGGM